MSGSYLTHIFLCGAALGALFFVLWAWSEFVL